MNDDTTNTMCRAIGGGRHQSMCAWEHGHSMPHAWDCDGLRKGIERLEAENAALREHQEMFCYGCD